MTPRVSPVCWILSPMLHLSLPSHSATTSKQTQHPAHDVCLVIAVHVGGLHVWKDLGCLGRILRRGLRSMVQGPGANNHLAAGYREGAPKI